MNIFRIEEHSKNLKIFTSFFEELFEIFNNSKNLDVRDDISKGGGICRVHDGKP